MNHIKSIEDLNKVAEELSTDERWVNVNSEVKQRVLNQLHKHIAHDLLDEQAKKLAKPKRSRAHKKQEESKGDGEKWSSCEIIQMYSYEAFMVTYKMSFIPVDEEQKKRLHDLYYDKKMFVGCDRLWHVYHQKFSDKPVSQRSVLDW